MDCAEEGLYCWSGASTGGCDIVSVAVIDCTSGLESYKVMGQDSSERNLLY